MSSGAGSVLGVQETHPFKPTQCRANSRDVISTSPSIPFIGMFQTF
jgi:hypothetical protein